MSNQAKRLSDCPAERLTQCRRDVAADGGGELARGKWRMVPVEPTDEMIRFAGVAVPKTPRAQWNAILAAAPVNPAGDEPVGYISPSGMFHKPHEYRELKLLMPEATLEENQWFGRFVKVYTFPSAVEELDAVLHWRGKHAHVVKEREALQQRLNIADQRVCDLQSELAESRKIQLSGCEFTEHELLARAVRAARGTSRGAVQRWVATKNAFGCGSGVANALCRRFGFDPDEMVKP